LLSSQGVVGESNVMRLGSTGSGNGQVNKCFIAGVTGVTTGATPSVALVDTNGQFGSTSAGATGTVLAGVTGASPTFTASPSVSGSVTAGTGITATTGNITATAGNVVITAGNLTLPNTNAAGTQGEITFGGNPFISNFGTNNTFVGQSSGNTTLTTAVDNAGFGTSTLSALTTGNSNVAVGYQALTAVTTGGGNVGIGLDALTAATQGIQNNAVGSSALFSLTTSNGNCAFGSNSLRTLLTGADNSAYGLNTGYSIGGNTGLTTGSFNLFLGNNAGSGYQGAESSNVLLANIGNLGESNIMRLGTSGSGNGQVNTCIIAGVTGVTPLGTSSVAIVDTGGQFGTLTGTTGTVLAGVTSANPTYTASPSVSGSVTAGTGITATTGNVTATAGNVVVTAGNLTLPNTNGAGTQGEIIFGGTTLISNFGTDNLFVGQSSGNTTLSGTQNTVFGSRAAADLTTASNTIAIGTATLDNLTTGSNNTGIGRFVMGGLTTGTNNIAIGALAGQNYTGSESNNIIIGNSTSGSESNAIRIGTGGTQTTCFIAGITGVTVTGSAVLCSTSGQLGTIASSKRYKDNITPMPDQSDALMNLRPVSFNYKTDPTKATQHGLIAEEVAEVLPYLAVRNAAGQPETVKYHELPTFLLQELQKQHAIMKEQNVMLKAQAETITQLRTTLDTLVTQLQTKKVI